MTREEILLIAKPILFNGDMVQAILDNMKSTTRRVVKGLDGLDVYRAEPTEQSLESGDLKEWELTYGFNDSHAFYDAYMEVKSPYKVGGYLYVRETWANLNTLACPCYYYRASEELPDWALGGWKPSIHMPKEAARIFLRVTDVRVERLQDIEDFVKEGVSPGTHATAHMNYYDEKCDFVVLWNSTIPKKDMDKYSWDANPWVWVIEFERVEV